MSFPRGSSGGLFQSRLLNGGLSGSALFMPRLNANGTPLQQVKDDNKQASVTDFKYCTTLGCYNPPVHGKYLCAEHEECAQDIADGYVPGSSAYKRSRDAATASTYPTNSTEYQEKFIAAINRARKRAPNEIDFDKQIDNMDSALVSHGKAIDTLTKDLGTTARSILNHDADIYNAKESLNQLAERVKNLEARLYRLSGPTSTIWNVESFAAKLEVRIATIEEKLKESITIMRVDQPEPEPDISKPDSQS